MPPRCRSRNAQPRAKCCARPSAACAQPGPDGGARGTGWGTRPPATRSAWPARSGTARLRVRVLPPSMPARALRAARPGHARPEYHASRRANRVPRAGTVRRGGAVPRRRSTPPAWPASTVRPAAMWTTLARRRAAVRATAPTLALRRRECATRAAGLRTRGGTSCGCRRDNRTRSALRHRLHPVVSARSPSQAQQPLPDRSASLLQGARGSGRCPSDNGHLAETGSGAQRACIRKRA